MASSSSSENFYLETLLTSTRPFLRGELETIEKSLPSLIAVLRSVGAGECWHKHDSFLEHLIEVEITQKIRVDGEVNRARCMPQNPVLIGAKTSGCEVFVFDYSKQAEKQGSDCDPELRLRGHDKEGYGLSWSPFKEGYLISGSHDHKICLWDVSALTQDKVIDAMQVYQAHESVVEDVSWHLKNENMFGSAGDDCQLIIWDVRTNQPQQAVKAHEKEINYLSVKGIDTLLTSDDPIGYQHGSFARNYLIDEFGIHESRLLALNSPEEYVKALNDGPEKGGVAAVVDEQAYLECTSCSF